jgi:hypothetical protein
MIFRLRRLPVLLPGLMTCLMFVFMASAQNASADHATNSSPNRTQFGTDITVGPDEQIGDATCFGCSVRVRGHVDGDVTVFFGAITVEEQGEVNGDLTNFGPGVRLDRSSKVGGDVTVFGGQVRRDADASVGGDVTNFKGTPWLLLVFGLPLLILAALVLFVVWLVRRLTRPTVPVTA